MNFASGLTILGEACNLNLNNHTLKFLTVNLKSSIAYIRGLISPTKVIFIYSGLISEYLDPSQNKNLFSLNQTDGYICLYSPY